MKKIWLLLFSVLLLTACGTKSTSEKADEELAYLDVKLTINPESAKINEPVRFQAKVMYGDKSVKDADEVSFEIWRSLSDKHEKIAIQHSKDGIYELEKNFTEEGTYYVYAHVTAEGMHSMPKKEFVIGQPSEPEEK
ncbi:FixH family protein [Bacillus massiliigorillae]|uniref:FixH family protein n=1 Tax=Bacillus massiliigorillae TaxID=1243664 RepID=UPI0003A16382|nr:FixH family protein [Bacillus massiliigorillae]